MTIDAEVISAIVSSAWPELRLVGEPDPLTGGFWAQMWRLQLADVMAGLHSLDPAPVTEAVRRTAPGVAWTVDEVVEQFRLGAGAYERPDVAAALERLTGRMPALSEPVICHGDLHPFNVLADAGGLTLLDWTGAVLADPRFDVAYTELLLSNPPLGVPRALDGLLRRAGRLFARRFVSAYAAVNPRTSLDDLEWFRALHSARIVIELTVRHAEHGADAGGHPFQLVAPGAAKELSATTGVEVRPWP